ncbi:MAG: glycosyltransferase family 4 protein [Coriobacteriia bacterium]
MKKRVCVVGPLPPPMGGDAKALQTLLDSASFKGHLSARTIDISDGKLRSAGGRVFAASKIRKILESAIALRRVARESRPDLYYLLIAQSAAGSLRDLLFLWVIRSHMNRDARVILHLHGGGFRGFYRSAPKLLQGRIRRSFGQVDASIVLSPCLVDMFEGILPESKVFVVPNGVDNGNLLSEADLRAKMEGGANRHATTFLYLSNMIKAKGYTDVLAAAVCVCRERSDCSVVFAGPFPDEPERRSFVAAIASADMGDRISYVGVVDGEQKYELLRDSDVFVLPTYFFNEGQPISILEAMGAGMPIITTRHGAIPDMVIDGVNGVFVRKQDPAHIADVMRRFCDERDAVKRIGLANRAKVMECFTEAQYASAMVELFLSVMAARDS